MTENTGKEKLHLTDPNQIEAKNDDGCNLQASFAILNKWSQLKRLRSGKEDEPSQLKHLQVEKRNGACSEVGGTASNSQVVSAVTIMRMAEMALSQCTSPKASGFSDLAKAFGFKSGLCHRSAEHSKHVFWLLDAAEKFSNEQYDQAEELLMSVLSSDDRAAHSIERVITYYARYLRERIEVKKYRIDLEREVEHVDVEEVVINLKAAILACEQKLPIVQTSNFAAIQTILDSVASAESIHFIDLGRKYCSYWIVMLHALAHRRNCQLKQFKITAVCTPRDDINEAGKLLSSFAESMNLPFVFKVLYTEIGEFDKLHFEFEAGETVAVFMDYYLNCLSACPGSIEALLGGLKNLNPHVMVVNDAEENFSTSTFSARFRGALSLSIAVSDSLESFLEGDNHFINIFERIHFQEAICKGVLSEDDDGFSRKIDFWREYFSKFGVFETDLSEASMYQASLMIRESGYKSSCSLSMNGKSMILCWKGTPLRFVSAWKFQQECNTDKDLNIML